MGGELGSRGERGSRLASHGEKPGRLVEKRGSRGEKRGDRCLVINSHWASASKASAPMEQVNIVWHFVFHLLHIYKVVTVPQLSLFTSHWLDFVFIDPIIISN